MRVSALTGAAQFAARDGQRLGIGRDELYEGATEMPDLSHEIIDLEAEIDRLSESADRCRKIILVGKVAAASGGILLLALVFGLFRLAGEAYLLAVAAILGGIVTFGSNQSTLDEIMSTIREHDTRRSEMIDAMELQMVGGGSGFEGR